MGSFGVAEYVIVVGVIEMVVESNLEESVVAVLDCTAS